jgi:hypothetical protein
MLNTASQLIFPVLTLGFFYFLDLEIRYAVERTGRTPESKSRFMARFRLALGIWAVVVTAWSLSGMFGRFDLFPLNAGPILIVPLITVPWFVFSKDTADIMEGMSQNKVLRLQVFRLFVEIGLWGLFVADQLPIQMTFEGRNFDILAGITGPVVSYLHSRNRLSRGALIAWNFLCLGLLLNIVVIAILSMPTPLQYFTNEPVNTVVAKFPVSFLPGFLVPLAYGLHFISLRKAFAERVLP